MNKKTLIAMICIPLAILVVVGILGAQYFFKPKDISVTSVEFITEDSSINTDASGGGTIQLEWKVLPEAATNKEVSFTSSNDKITVSDTGLVSSSTPFEGAVITVKTEDGNKTDTVVISTYSSQVQTLSYNFAENSINLGDSSQVVQDNDTYVLFKGIDYGFTAEEDVVFDCTTENFAVVENKFSANETGSFVFKATKGDVTKNFNVKIVDKITTLSLKANMQDKTNYVVGNQNAYTLQFLTNVANASSDIIKTEVFDNHNALLTGEVLDNAVSITGVNTFKFKNVVGNSYTIKLSSKYTDVAPVSVTVAVEDYWNVANHEQLLAAYNEGANQKAKIVLVDDITVDVDSRMTLSQDGKTYVRTGTSENQQGGRIYVRYADLVLEGNGHLVSAENAKYFSRLNDGNGVDEKFCHDGNAPIFTVAKIAGGVEYSQHKEFYYHQALYEHSLTSGDDITEANSGEYIVPQREYMNAFYDGTGEFRAVNVTFNNVNIKANSGLNVVNRDDATEYVGFRTLNGIRASGANLTLNNCHISNVLNGVTSKVSASVTINNSTIEDVAGFCVYTKQSKDLTLNNSKFAKAGHVAVLPQTDNCDKMADSFTYWPGVKDFLTATNKGQQNDSQYFDAYGAPIAANLPNEGHTLTLKGNVQFDNWIDINNSAFLQADKASYAAATQIKGAIIQLLGENMGLLLQTKEGETFNGSNFDALVMNYGIQIESVAVRSTVNFTTVKNEMTNQNPYFDHAAMFKTVMNNKSGGTLYSDFAAQQGIQRAMMNTNGTLMDLGLNTKPLNFGGHYWLSQFILGVNDNFQQA